MQATVEHIEAIASIRDRVQSCITNRIDDKSALAIAIQSSLLKKQEVIAFEFTGFSRSEVLNGAKLNAIRKAEWESIFNADMHSRLVRVENIDRFSKTPEFQKEITRMEAALRCTLMEHEQMKLWSHPATKLAAWIAAHMESEAEEKIETLFGTMVKADMRRIEDLKSDMEDEDSDTLLISEAVFLLSQSATL